jgi:RHH-type transcriptional regulator, rel operon repressor / antitoxin RelB
MSRTMTIRIDDQSDQRLTALAKVVDRSKAYIALEAIRKYLELNEWQLAAIQEGLQEVKAGKTISHDEVEQWVASWGADEELEQPK